MRKRETAALVAVFGTAAILWAILIWQHLS